MRLFGPLYDRVLSWAKHRQLAPGGRLIMPVGPPGAQELTMLLRRDDHFEQSSLGGVSFVPLVKGK